MAAAVPNSILEHVERDRAEGRGSDVYTEHYEEPDRTMTANEVMDVLVNLRTDFNKLVRVDYQDAFVKAKAEAQMRATTMGKPQDAEKLQTEIAVKSMPTDEYYREKLKSSSKHYALFARSNDHQRMFEFVTTASRTPEEFLMGCYIPVYLRQLVDKGSIPESAAGVLLQDYCRYTAAVAKAEDDKTKNSAQKKLEEIPAIGKVTLPEKIAMLFFKLY